MQSEFPSIDFADQAEVRLKAEHRRTEEITGLLRALYQHWAASFRQSKPSIFAAVSHSPARAGN